MVIIVLVIYMKINERIRFLRTQLGMTQEELAKKMGYRGKSAISKIESGENDIGQSMIQKYADALGVTPAFLLFGNDGVDDTDDVVEFRVVGEVAAGYEHIAQENWEGDTIEIPRSYLHGRPASDYMVLSVVGDSMYPEYRDGDRVLIKKCDTMPCSGRVGLFRYNGENATLKRIDYINGEDWVKLVPINPMYPPVKITGEDLTRCAVIGVPVCLIREIDND